MKNILLLPIVVFLLNTSCTKKELKVDDKGTVIVLNGKGIKDTISYTCVNCDSLLNSDTATFNLIVKNATLDTRNMLNYPLSFVPVKMEVAVSKLKGKYSCVTNSLIENTLEYFIKYSYIGKNAFGAELEGDVYHHYYTHLGKLQDLTEEIRLDSLKMVDGYINRTLVLNNSDGEKLEIMPCSDKELIVQSSLNCVDQGAQLTLFLENDHQIRLYSWNNFNCTGSSYFRKFKQAEIDLLSKYKLNSVMLFDDKSVYCSVPLNNEDYFIQTVSIFGK